jgi:hypothetical protein
MNPKRGFLACFQDEMVRFIIPAGIQVEGRPSLLND